MRSVFPEGRGSCAHAPGAAVAAVPSGGDSPAPRSPQPWLDHITQGQQEGVDLPGKWLRFNGSHLIVPRKEILGT